MHRLLGALSPSCLYLLLDPEAWSFGEAAELELPETFLGENGYLYAPSLRHPEAVRCRAAQCPTLRRTDVGQCGPLTCGALTVKLYQQYETPTRRELRV